MSSDEKYTTINLEPKDEAQRMAILVVMNEGALRERERVAELVKNKICFDNLEGRGCDHQACYELIDLLKKINV